LRFSPDAPSGGVRIALEEGARVNARVNEE
jgi:hypothetical protein